MPVMTSQILNRWISQKSRYLKNETFFPKKKEQQIKGYFMAKNSFIAKLWI